MTPMDDLLGMDCTGFEMGCQFLEGSLLNEKTIYLNDVALFEHGFRCLANKLSLTHPKELLVRQTTKHTLF